MSYATGVIPACFLQKAAADKELERVSTAKVVSVEEYCKAAERQRRARRNCEIYFKPAEKGGTA